VSSPGEAVTPYERVLALLTNVKRQPGGGAMANCPGHDDTTASLKIDEGDGGSALMHDHGGCPTEKILAEIGLTMADLFPNSNGRVLKAVPTKIVAVFDYKDAEGSLVYQVVRYEPKKFKQRRPNGSGGWIWDLKGVSPLLYRLPELMAASADDWVFIPEGEKHVDAIRALGLEATCNSRGRRQIQD
jgi:putative DNA primase/helicase